MMFGLKTELKRLKCDIETTRNMVNSRYEEQLDLDGNIHSLNVRCERIESVIAQIADHLGLEIIGPDKRPARVVKKEEQE